MLHKHERLLVKLIEQYHGLISSLAAKVLIYHGAITFKRALSYTTLSKKDFEKGLEILVRCQYVQIDRINKEKLLTIECQKIVDLLYYPQFLVVTRNRFSFESALLMKTLFLYGRLSQEDLIERTLFHTIQINGLELDDEQIKFYIASLKDKFQELFENRIIIPIDSKSTKTPICNENKILEAIKKNLDQTETKSRSTLIKSKSFYSFNIEALNYLYFVEMFPFFLNQQFPNEEATSLFEILLEMTFKKTFALKETTFSYQEILKQFREKYPKMGMMRLTNLLNICSHFFAPNFLVASRVNCSLDFDTFLFDIVKIIVKEYIKKNFGENSVRVFGALLEENCIFENNLLNCLKIDTKELHRNIYLLDQSQMISIMFYSDANQSSTFSGRNIKKVFTVNLNDVIEIILERCYYSIFTILHRRTIEADNQKDLISRKNHIENYKKEISLNITNENEKNGLIKTAHNYMSDKDHKFAESLLNYISKVDQVETHLTNNIFMMNLWKMVSKNKKDNVQD